MAENFFYLEKKTSIQIQETQAIKKKKKDESKETHTKTHENGSDAPSRRPKKQQEKSNLLHTRESPTLPRKSYQQLLQQKLYRPKGDRETEYIQNAEGKNCQIRTLYLESCPLELRQRFSFPDK